MTKKQLLLEILRFLIVGGLATLVDYAVFYLFRKWLLPPALIAESGGWDTASLVIATALGFCAGLTVNWILSVRFVFRNVKDKEKSRSKKPLRCLRSSDSSASESRNSACISESLFFPK